MSKNNEKSEMVYRKELGARLKYLRTDKGLTQADVVAATNVKQPSIVRYESGTRTPDAYFIMKYAEMLECNLTWLISGEGQPYPIKKPQENAS